MINLGPETKPLHPKDKIAHSATQAQSADCQISVKWQKTVGPMSCPLFYPLAF